MPLGKVFDLIYEKTNGGTAIDSKTDADKLRSWFEEILPEYSKDKVYTSDIKKVAQWYNILHNLKLLVKEEPEKAVDEKTAGPKPAKAKPAKEKAAKAKQSPEAGTKKKKAAPKSKTE